MSGAPKQGPKAQPERFDLQGFSFGVEFGGAPKRPPNGNRPARNLLGQAEDA